MFNNINILDSRSPRRVEGQEPRVTLAAQREVGRGEDEMGRGRGMESVRKK